MFDIISQIFTLMMSCSALGMIIWCRSLILENKKLKKELQSKDGKMEK